MTTSQVNTGIYRSLGIISEDENMLRKVAKYLQRVAKKMTEDSTLMSKEDFFARVDCAAQEPSHELLMGEDLTTYLKRRGYDL